MKAGYTIDNHIYDEKANIAILFNFNDINKVGIYCLNTNRMLRNYNFIHSECIHPPMSIGVFQPKGTKAKRESKKS